ncbi:hypothetical protein RJ641_017498 [Dillenia turbinata]|uniref:Uncharacterized protein n=1 Tax=Dillenia turbinata TaxID=194707 RepID=A0AAN8UWV0_9MAGN
MFRNSNSDQILTDMVFGVFRRIRRPSSSRRIRRWKLMIQGMRIACTAEENKEFWEAQEKLVQRPVWD